jgi:hypothetical protein
MGVGGTLHLAELHVESVPFESQDTRSHELDSRLDAVSYSVLQSFKEDFGDAISDPTSNISFFDLVQSVPYAVSITPANTPSSTPCSAMLRLREASRAHLSRALTRCACARRQVQRAFQTAAGQGVLPGASPVRSPPCQADEARRLMYVWLRPSHDGRWGVRRFWCSPPPSTCTSVRRSRTATCCSTLESDCWCESGDNVLTQ